jgi:hypothetical protein
MAETVGVKARVIDLLNQGLTPREIRWQIHSVSPCMISHCVRLLGLPKFKDGRPMFIENIEAEKIIRQLLIEGKTPKQILKEVDVSSSFITQCRERLGMKKFARGRGITNLRRHRRAKRLREQKFSYAAIGKILGVSRQRATKLASVVGIGD